MFRRKQRHAESELPPVSSSRRSSASSNIPSSLTKSVSETTLVDDGGNDTKGALGLTLLHSPPNPQVDLIFIHGLGGGSRKTWSKTSLLSHYWPQQWLPKDPAFKDVQIFTYGYDSDYLSGKGDCLNIHHIGKSFLGEVSTSPYIAQSQTNIIAVGHSMGGLVIKKAIILAKQDDAHQALASRFAAVYFLATPHRGADSAKTLKNILRAVHERAYVADLERKSGAIQVINDEFRHFSPDLELWSFYETQSMKLFSSLIVDSESAVLGYREEMQMPMTADHRSICKFDSQFDANYIILRNALASTVAKISTVKRESKKESRNQLSDIRRYLGVSEVFEDDFLTAQDARMPGSCQWIATKDTYVEWRDAVPGRGGILWVKGKPAAGKSVLAGYVIDQLQGTGHACSYFFFKHGDKSKSRLGACLRTLAFQMACSNSEAQDTILTMQRDGVRLSDADERTLWRLLFLSGVFQTTITQHYWVIDALDECFNVSALFDAILPKLEKSFPLKILITSRNTANLEQSFSGLAPSLLQTFSISVTDTLADIKLSVENRAEGLSIVGLEGRSSLVEKIIEKSNGSFLWTILVLKELRSCHSKKEIDQILEDVPTDMEHMYKRILDSMSQSIRGKELAKAVLVWTACAVRPMTVTELSGALTLDIGDTFPKLEESISSLCGQLVAVDKFGKVQMVHGTVREFLLKDGLDSEFAIDKGMADTRIAEGCLKYLTEEEMKPPRTNRRRTMPTKRASFALYACTAFPYHLSRADPQAKELFEIVGQFLKSNILTWIEVVTRSPGPGQLISASRHLKIYYDACCPERSPLHPVLRALKQWAADLARIAAKFSNALKTSPSAIYSLIPPFCPTGSMLYSIGNQGRKITVLGAQSEEWDDRISCVDFRQSYPSALCYGDKFLAIGLTTGAVALYDATSYQEHKVLDHGEAVKFIRFKNKTDLIATCGMKMTKVWDTRTGEMVHGLSSPPRPLDMEFHNGILLVASHKNYIAGWDLEDHARPEPDRRWSDSPELGSPPPRRPPCAVSICPAQGMLAVAYSGQPITLWDLVDDAYCGSCGKKLSSGETSSHVVVALAFNPNPNIGLIAVAYLDGDLALLDPFADLQLECFRANCQTLAASPDGRFLAAGGAGGIIDVYGFDTFRLLYRVKSYNSYIKQLSFAKDSLHIADIRGAQCSVWEPAALLRYSIDDDSSGTTSASIINTVTLESKAKITVLAVHHTAEVIFSGRDNGAVLLYCRKTAACLRTLYTHKSSIRLLVWCQDREALLSVDGSNRIFMYKVQRTANGDWSADPTMLFQSRLQSENAIVNVLVSEVAGRFVVSTRESDHLFNLDGSHEAERAYQGILSNRKWIIHPKSPLHMICFSGLTARMYRWRDWEEIGCLSLPTNNDMARLKSLTVYPCGQERRILLELAEDDGSNKTSGVMILSQASLVIEDETSSSDLQLGSDAAPSIRQVEKGKDKEIRTATSSLAALYAPQITGLSQDIAHIISIDHSGRLVFLDHCSWVCSADLGIRGLEAKQGVLLPAIEYFRHFFVPYDWFAGRRDFVCALAQKDVLFARGGDLAIVRGWLEHAEKVGKE
ncbi:hypothetical protein CONLIGDRAFT_7590 [Coniochaeta ligniaria NRRL 30616]|uniref:GPI inositol-deacylase n=1 Tax=Coniochaeta ligniaria NRRL 30616 TaxID=1408157 RepID=A0A1J7JM73_9PEZI|nr:hypothetical protein CONLIGDRAFT_7590 [Coniochaeta ligniaria NRRL 30616]